MLDPFRGINDELADLIDQKHYFVIHAARQSGKTTLLKELARKINAEGEYYALYCSLEATGMFTEPEKGIPEIVGKIESYLKNYGLPPGFAKDANYGRIGDVLNLSFVEYCRSLDKPLVVFFDEADCLANGTLISFLRQLREGYVNRPDAPFIHSVALVGMRNLGDYKTQIRAGAETLGGMSPFNIVKKCFSLRNFTKAEVVELYAQHTTEAGQMFEPEMIDYTFEQTQGQPWLVNAVACECIEEIIKKDYSIPITKEFAEQAVQNISLSRRTHTTSMIERLKEPRVRKIVEPVILGSGDINETTDDYQYTKDIGLIRDDRGIIEPANPIYAELIIRVLIWYPQDSIYRAYREYDIPRYLKDGKLDMSFLISDFQQYWRENSDIWVKRYQEDLYQYNEAAAHLVIQAFLQRVVNGGGYIIRKMALGTGRCDLCVVYDGHKYPIELKIKQNIREQSKIYEQILKYMDSVGSDVGWFVIFDKDAEKCWDDKVYVKEEIVDGKRVVVAGC
jgi:hypothetical protein